MGGKKKLIIFVGMTLVLFLGWILGTGLVQVEPQTVRIVRVWEPGSEYAKAKPFINNSNSPRFYLTWPWIPGTDIGTKEESYSLNAPLVLKTEVELFSLANLTGNQDDANKIVCLVISGNVQVTDWEKFLRAFDPKASLEKQGKSRSRIELLTEEIQSDIRLPFTIFWGSNFTNFCSRAYFANKFAKDFNLTTTSQVEEFIKNKRTWYWVLGPTYLTQLQEMIKRNVLPDPLIAELAVKCYLADETEREINYITKRLFEIKIQKEALYEGFADSTLKRAELVFSQFVSYLAAQDKEFPFVWDLEKELSDFMIKNQIEGVIYSAQEHYVVRTLVNLEAEKLRLMDYQNRLEEVTSNILKPFFERILPYVDEKEFVFWRAAIQGAIRNPKLLLAVLVGDFYNLWFKTPDGMKYFKDYWEKGLLLAMIERDLGAELDLSFEIQEKVPTK